MNDCDIKIVVCDNINYIGKYQSHNDKTVLMKDVYIINTSIRDDKIIILNNIKYIDNGEVLFNNYQYIARANNVAKNSYLRFNNESKTNGN